MVEKLEHAGILVLSKNDEKNCGIETQMKGVLA